MKISRQLSLLLFYVSVISTPALATRAAEIRNVTVVPRGDDLVVQVKLSAEVTPRVVTAIDPDRLVLELPNTVSSAKQKHIPVNQDGVKELRIGLTSVAPLMTRVVLDLDTARPYDLERTGNTIALKVLPAGSPSVELQSPAKSAVSDDVASRPTPVAAMVPPPVTSVTSRRVRAGFKVKFVAEGSVYLAAGRSAGLEEGMRLSVRESSKGAGRFLVADEEFPVVAELRIVSVAANSAVTEVSGAKRSLRLGDWAYLSVEDSEALARNKVAGVNTGTSARASGVEFVPDSFVRAPLPGAASLEVGRVNARIGLDYSGISSHGLTTGTSSQIGLSARADITRIGGTYWNLEGYWRGRITRRSRTDQDTLRDVLNKTYTMQLNYDNPNSSWVAGFGRLYLPWANSLDTIDGGYFGRRVKKGVTAGVFAGSTPDPTSWSYNPDRRIGGTFVNFEGGSYESFHYTSTAGAALSTLKWDLDRPFVFFENGLDYKHSISVYHSLILDAPQGVTTSGIKPGAGISRSYLTVHYQPYRRVSFDFNHNYFRDVPTASTQLVGTGLVDKLLYQGFSVGMRVEPIRHVFLYSTIGHSDKTGDKEGTLNWMQGLTWDEIGRTGLRVDVRYSKFDSFFASGNYKVLTLSRHLGDRMTWDAQFGSQSLASSLTANQSSHFADTSLDMNLGAHSYFQSGYTVVRGAQTNYNQWYLSLGFRIDGRPAKK